MTLHTFIHIFIHISKYECVVIHGGMSATGNDMLGRGLSRNSRGEWTIYIIKEMKSSCGGLADWVTVTKWRMDRDRSIVKLYNRR